MKRFFISTLTVALVLALAGLAHAGPNKGNNSGNGPKMGNNNGNGGSQAKDPKQQVPQKLTPKVDFKNYQCYNGLKCSFGWCFPGFDHCHWTYKCWFVDCGCYCNWCPSTCCYYYYCVPDLCWYPISYCPYGKYVW